MALATTAALLNLGNLLSTSVIDVTQVSSTPQHRLGTLSIQVDNFGYHRMFRYVRWMAAQSAGGLGQRCALVTGTADTTPNTTTALTDAGTFTAGDEVGKICQINVASGAAPEGESALIERNGTGTLVFDSGYPLSAAVEVADTYSNWGIAHYIAGAVYSDAAPAGNAINVSGIAMGAAAAGDYGWAQIHGFHPAVNLDAGTAAITTGSAGALGAASTVILLATGGSQQDLYIGWFPMATSDTAVQAGFVIDTFTQSQPVV